MRPVFVSVFAIALLTLPAYAWEFRHTPICTLTHSTSEADITVTYDHATALYAIAVTAPAGWPAAPAFSIRFDGPSPNTISTTRHIVTDKTLTVTDKGFGNVLDGIARNTTATAFTNTAAVAVSLDGAAGPVAEFRACATSPSV